MNNSSEPFPSPSWREHGCTLLFAGMGSALLFSATWGKVLFYRDLLRWFYPSIFFFRQSLLAGEFPLWNPYLFLGYPFLAEMANAVLYPLSLLHLLVSIPTVLKIYPAVHYFLTGYLMWRLLREWGLSHLAGWFGALTWMASGYLVSMHANLNYLAPAAWYPAVLFCFHRLLATQKIGWLLGTASAWAMVFLAGDPQAFFWAGVLLLSYVSFVGQEFFLYRRRALALAALVGLLTFMLVLAQFLPSLEFGAWCTRFKGISFQEAASWSHHPWRLLEWVWPGLWGQMFPPEEFWGRFFGYSLDFTSTWTAAVSIGLFPLLLAFAQFRHWRQPPLNFLVFTAILFFLLALGYYSPLYRLVWALFPPYRIFRFPEKHLAVATLALASLAAFGFQRVFVDEAGSARRAFLRAWILLLVGLAAVLAVFLASGHGLASPIALYLAQKRQFVIAPDLIYGSLLRAFARAPALAAALLLVIIATRKPAFLRRHQAHLLLALTAFDLLGFGRTLFHGIDPYLYSSEPRATRLIRENEGGSPEPYRVFRPIGGILTPMPLAEPLGLTEAEKRIFFLRHTLAPNTAVPEGLETMFGHEPAQPDRLIQWSQQPLRPTVLQMLNVKYVLDGIEQGRFPVSPVLSVIGSDPDRNLAVLSLSGAFPRAYFTDGIFSAADEAAALDQMTRVNFTQGAIIEADREESRAGKVLRPGRIVSYGHDQIEVEVMNPVPGHLVLSDSYSPGWEAKVDGQPARILRANYLVRAVPLDPGEHRVVFTYRPRPWRIGRDASLVSLLFIPIALYLRKVRRSTD